ncbi:MAG: hypothetical protein AAB373_04220 [Patescibacteria group bacterium]
MEKGLHVGSADMEVHQHDKGAMLELKKVDLKALEQDKSEINRLASKVGDRIQHVIDLYFGDQKNITEKLQATRLDSLQGLLDLQALLQKLNPIIGSFQSSLRGKEWDVKAVNGSESISQIEASLNDQESLKTLSTLMNFFKVVETFIECWENESKKKREADRQVVSLDLAEGNLTKTIEDLQRSLGKAKKPGDIHAEIRTKGTELERTRDQKVKPTKVSRDAEAKLKKLEEILTLLNGDFASLADLERTITSAGRVLGNSPVEKGNRTFTIRIPLRVASTAKERQQSLENRPPSLKKAGESTPAPESKGLRVQALLVATVLFGAGGTYVAFNGGQSRGIPASIGSSNFDNYSRNAPRVLSEEETRAAKYAEFQREFGVVDDMGDLYNSTFMDMARTDLALKIARGEIKFNDQGLYEEKDYKPYEMIQHKELWDIVNKGQHSVHKWNIEINRKSDSKYTVIYHFTSTLIVMEDFPPIVAKKSYIDNTLSLPEEPMSEVSNQSEELDNL